jgi:hypothetical protein
VYRWDREVPRKTLCKDLTGPQDFNGPKYQEKHFNVFNFLIIFGTNSKPGLAQQNSTGQDFMILEASSPKPRCRTDFSKASLLVL